jgi:hypothetical protein
LRRYAPGPLSSKTDDPVMKKTLEKIEVGLSI